jgi:transposase, IS30 family
MPGRRLSDKEREEISRGVAEGQSFAEIGRGLRRPTSTVSREVDRNGGRCAYRGWKAQMRAGRLCRRRRLRKLLANNELRQAVNDGLAKRWSPAQISARLRREHPDDPSWWVSHETIYRSLYVQAGGGLRKELRAALRTGRARRVPRGHGRRMAGARIPGMVLISERPAEVEDRAVPGHWEGDLIIGGGQGSQIGTLVERSTRFVMLVHLPLSRGADAVADGVASKIVQLPEHLRHSLTWDQGSEMAHHARVTVDAGVEVYFCDPHSPWQRGTNENTNGLLRQYFPKGTDLSRHTEAQLDAVAQELNGRPRKTLSWMTPLEKLAELVAMDP